MRLLIKKLLREQIEDIYDFHELLMEKIWEAFEQIKDNDINLNLNKINPSMYQKALSEFVKYNEFIKFPTKYIFKW